MNPNLSEMLADGEAEVSDLDPEIMLEQILADPDLVQHVVRTNRDGCETVVGFFRCLLETGMQRYILHVPFTPPLANIPEVESMITERSDVRARVTDRQKFGTRIEVILPCPAESPTTLLVEVIATLET